MPVQITIYSPTENQQNVPIDSNGNINVTGCADEDCTLTSSLTVITDHQGPLNFGAGTSVLAYQDFSLYLAANPATHYSLTLTGTNSNGVGSTTVTFHTAARLPVQQRNLGAMFTGRVYELGFIEAPNLFRAVIRDRKDVPIAVFSRDRRIQNLLKTAFLTEREITVIYTGNNLKMLTKVNFAF